MQTCPLQALQAPRKLPLGMLDPSGGCLEGVAEGLPEVPASWLLMLALPLADFGAVTVDSGAERAMQLERSLQWTQG